MKIELEVISATVLKTTGTDLLIIKFDKSSTYPSWLPDESPILKIELQKGYGIEYCQKEFGIDPEFIDTSASMGTPKNF